MGSTELRVRALDEREAERRRICEYRGLHYERYNDDGRGIDRGTIIIGGKVVPTYPSIGRISTLEAGVRHNLPGPFSVEEKVDGYNVRIVRAGGRLVAFTRGGWACPFTCDRLNELADLHPIFDDEPDLVVCAELAGPENPYINVPTPQVPEDVQLFVFDLMRLDQASVIPVGERDEILGRHEVPRAGLLGHLRPDELPRLREIVLELDARAIEGVVLKPLESGRPVKYVTPSVNLSDVVEDADLLAELPGSFFTDRIVRMVMAIEELGLSGRLAEYERRLGRSLLEEFEKSVRQLRRTGVVSQRYRFRVREEAAANELLTQLNRNSKSVQVREVARRFDGEYHRVEFDKVYQHSTSYLKTLIAGDAVID